MTSRDFTMLLLGALAGVLFLGFAVWFLGCF